MDKIFATYGALILMTLLFANHEGYAFSSLFDNHRHGGRGSGGAWVHSYHK